MPDGRLARPRRIQGRQVAGLCIFRRAGSRGRRRCGRNLRPVHDRREGGLMDERQRRVGENEVLYRSVNERIEELNATFGTMTDSLTVVCECGRAACAEQIELPASDYERVRADPALFIIIPGHEIPDVEDVVET